MPASASPKAKPNTRSSIRQSLNLSSMGKAIVDVMKSTDNKDSAKAAKKTKDASTRRSSVLVSPPTALRPSMDNPRPLSQVSKRTETPENKTGHRRRNSALPAMSSADESSSKASENPVSISAGVQSRVASLRPRTANGTVSALPKYRPKSILGEVAKPPSPTRVGTRRRLSTSDDEKKEQKKPASASASVTLAEKTARPISPLPHRAALKANLTNSVNITPPTTPSKPKNATPLSEPKGSPSRPNKIVKTATATLPRPPSSSSSSLSLNPPTITPKASTPKGSTPKTSGLKAKLGLVRSAQAEKAKASESSPLRNSPSPSRHAREKSKSTATSSSNAGNMSHISEGNSEEEDSDADDVALLLAPVAAIGAPTPAMPRIQTNRRRIAPQTPTRPNVSNRANMSYLSPVMPSSTEKSSSLRPSDRGSDQAMRGSIMSWEQLANDTSITLGEDEFGRMLSDIPAPFRSGAASPSLSSQLGVPESPCLSALDSPGGYGSISQVLLPDVTPSPALHNSLQHSRFNASLLDSTPIDSSTTTLLRLQLAAAENTAKERLHQIQAMEEELHDLKQCMAQQMEESQRQITYMENQWRSSSDDTASLLEEQMQKEQTIREQIVAEAITRCQEEAKQTIMRSIEEERLKFQVVTSAQLASSSWDNVLSACEDDLEAVRSDKAMLSVLLMQLDQLSQTL
ncbi:hypothetical protein CPC08DRAFT_702527 [Agrocybe pediades]|nr:hypothetical protein CPC08DRAFT_702527 [Agrocybe pediades]